MKSMRLAPYSQDPREHCWCEERYVGNHGFTPLASSSRSYNRPISLSLSRLLSRMLTFFFDFSKYHLLLAIYQSLACTSENISLVLSRSQIHPCVYIFTHIPFLLLVACCGSIMGYPGTVLFWKIPSLIKACEAGGCTLEACWGDPRFRPRYCARHKRPGNKLMVRCFGRGYRASHLSCV